MNKIAMKKRRGEGEWMFYCIRIDAISKRANEKKWEWSKVDWSPFKSVWLRFYNSRACRFSYSKLRMEHDPTFDDLYIRCGQIPSPLCRCGLRETTCHYYFECPHLHPLTNQNCHQISSQIGTITHIP